MRSTGNVSAAAGKQINEKETVRAKQGSGHAYITCRRETSDDKQGMQTNVRIPCVDYDGCMDNVLETVATAAAQDQADPDNRAASIVSAAATETAAKAIAAATAAEEKQDDDPVTSSIVCATSATTTSCC